uniref:Uncharacterized protein n=1 Tax=Amphimedon queenslandica TaxID=400682 RepID=A0A1X7VS66_AMPQE
MISNYLGKQHREFLGYRCLLQCSLQSH